MNGYLSSLYNRNVYLILLASLALPTMSNAERYEFKVIYAEVPGIEDISAVNHVAAIEILESRAKDASNHYVTNELATLCALYIVKNRLVTAHKTCQVAVETDQSDAAYNNRGVLRVHLGDTAGAMEDFERARVLPHNKQRYIEELMRTDARLVASRNFAVAIKYSVRRSHLGQTLANSVRSASVEDLSN